MMRMQKSIEKNHDKGSSTDVGSREMSSMMTNLDATNQQLFNMKERLEKARTQSTNNEEKLSDFETKHSKLVMVAENYNIDHTRVKEYINAVKPVKVNHDRTQVQAEQKLTQMQEKKAQADFKKDKIKSKLDELLAKKEKLAEEMKSKKEKLYSLVADSKDIQNKAIKMSRAIRSDKDAYLKLGSLQTSTTKGQATLKGWHPENLNSISVKKSLNTRSNVNNSALLNQSIESQNFKSPDIDISQKAISISGSMKELKYLSGGDRVNNKK